MLVAVAEMVAYVLCSSYLLLSIASIVATLTGLSGNWVRCIAGLLPFAR